VKSEIEVESNTNDVCDRRIFHSFSLKERGHFGDLVEEEMKKLKWIFKKYSVRMWSWFSCLRLEQTNNFQRRTLLEKANWLRYCLFVMCSISQL